MRKRSVKQLAAVMLIALSLGIVGCAPWSPVPATAQNAAADSDLILNSYLAADALLDQVPWLKESRQPLLTASFVNVNSLENSSGLGRMIAEQIASRFAQQGFTMVEVKLRNNLFIKQNAGEFVLSRSVKDISESHNVAAVIAGTYVVGRRSIYVNARLIRAADNLILAAYDYSLPLGPDTRALLASQ
jgi:TolB-like protein